MCSQQGSGPFNQRDFALARYNPDGTLDTGFSGDGKQTTDLGGNGAKAVALQSDGKILAAGTVSDSIDKTPPRETGSDLALARYGRRRRRPG